MGMNIAALVYMGKEFLDVWHVFSQYIRNYGSIGSCAKLGQADILRKPLVIASSGQMTDTDHLPPITYTYPSYSNIPKVTLKDL